MGAVKNHYWDAINAVSCEHCNGNGEFEYDGGRYVCPHCKGAGECECDDCTSTAAENAWSAMCEGEPPYSAAERDEINAKRERDWL